MDELKRTVLNDTHKALGGQMVEFGGWEMPLQYPTGVIEEHLSTRRQAGIFDVSHMGRFIVRGSGAVPFLQHVLTNNAEALDLMPTGAQYTLIADEAGGAIDDAYLYRFVEGEFLLVVNASNRLKDWRHLVEQAGNFEGVELIDRTEEITMIALQGPLSRKILAEIVEGGRLPEPFRNAVGVVQIGGATVWAGRTGYTGEPLCFELFTDREHGCALWDLLASKGAKPIGLAARDTLRLEAGLPLYGHEFGQDPEGKEFPIFAVSLGKFGVSFSPLKGDFIGKAALAKQFAAYAKIIARDFSDISGLPRMIRPVAVTGHRPRLNSPRQLADAGIEFALTAQEMRDEDGLVRQGTLAASFGLPAEAALQSITAAPARLLQLEDQVGTLQPGLAADLVVWSAEPLNPASKPVLVMIGGRIVLDGDKLLPAIKVTK